MLRSFAFTLLMLPLIASAQAPAISKTQAPAAKRINVNANSTMKINYGHPGWNKSATDIDTAIVIMRDTATGSLVQIQLNETAPDSSLFTGRFSINFNKEDRLQAEFFIPSQEQIKEKDGVIKVTAKIVKGELTRNPFILRRLPTGEQSIEIFDTREQARGAMKAYKAEQMIMLQSQQALANANTKPGKFPADQDLEAQKIAEDARQKQEAARAASDRARLEQLEAKRLEELKAKQAALSEQEKEREKARARALADQGLKLYQDEDFMGARTAFDEAVALDPDNRVFYYQYGIALYKTSDFNRALVTLRLADDASVNKIERSYFMALSHFRLKETEAALKTFDEVVASKDTTLAPSARFYKGVILYEREDWKNAQDSFQQVLDTSKDPKLDERAEAYIEQIMRAQQYEVERSRKWTLSATVGEMYDSNVLLISNSLRDTGSATDTQGWRALFAGSARYRPVYEETWELAAQLDAVTLYTLDKRFQNDDSLRNLDPTIVTAQVPWTRKGLLWGRGHRLEITPGYESTFMSLEYNTNKAIIDSVLLGISNLLIVNDSWFSTLLINIRRDKSNLSTSVGDDDSTALRVAFTSSNLVFLNGAKDRMLLAEGGIMLNQAEGKNAVYQRVDLGVGYIRPWKWSTSLNLKLGYFLLQYPQAAVSRTDNSLTLSAGLSRKISDIWSAGFLTAYNLNNSNSSANNYDKVTALLTLSAAYGL